jgi:hypothetical protein
MIIATLKVAILSACSQKATSRGFLLPSRQDRRAVAVILDRVPGTPADRADPKAEYVAAVGFERPPRIMAGLDESAAEREHWRRGVDLDAERGAPIGPNNFRANDWLLLFGGCRI